MEIQIDLYCQVCRTKFVRLQDLDSDDTKDIAIRIKANCALHAATHYEKEGEKP